MVLRDKKSVGLNSPTKLHKVRLTQKSLLKPKRKAAASYNLTQTQICESIPIKIFEKRKCLIKIPAELMSTF